MWRWIALGALGLDVVLAIALVVQYRRGHDDRPQFSVAGSGWYHQPAVGVFAQLPTRPGAVVFLGDSLTAEGPWGELFGPWVNRGIKGDTVDGIARRLDEVLVRKPSKIFLLAGVNDLIQGRSAEDVAGRVARLVGEARTGAPESRLFLLSLLPVDELRCPVRNGTVRAVNERLERLASEHDVTYVDLFSKFVDESGSLEPRLTYDGLHLTPAGYVIWRDTLAPHITDAR